MAGILHNMQVNGFHREHPVKLDMKRLENEKKSQIDWLKTVLN